MAAHRGRPPSTHRTYDFSHWGSRYSWITLPQRQSRGPSILSQCHAESCGTFCPKPLYLGADVVSINFRNRTRSRMAASLGSSSTSATTLLLPLCRLTSLRVRAGAAPLLFVLGGIFIFGRQTSSFSLTKRHHSRHQRAHVPWGWIAAVGPSFLFAFFCENGTIFSDAKRAKKIPLFQKRPAALFTTPEILAKAKEFDRNFLEIFSNQK